MFEPTFFAVLRGTKFVSVCGQRHELKPSDCVATSFGLPYISQVVADNDSSPYTAVSLALDTSMMVRVMLDMPKAEVRHVCSAKRSRLEGHIGRAFLRLVELLSSPEDIGVLAPHFEAELYYRLLQSPMGDTLRQIGQRNSRMHQIEKAADWLSRNSDKPCVVCELAASVGMSLTSFHRHFKSITGYSPIAVQRHVRLLEARKILISGSANVSSAAYAVGYQSASQFSREYKRMFGASPLADLAHS
jgi:AraC-like DNA-binding protein